MARLPRLVVPGQLHHIIARGNNDQPAFLDDSDYVQFQGWLKEAALRAEVAVHAFVLLPKRVQLLATPASAAGLSKMMQTLGRHYVPYFNAKYARTGSLWEGRFRATVLEAATYFLPCSAIIEYQPVASGISTEHGAYPWSSYAHHSGSGKSALITDHPAYWALGNTPFEREAAYRQLSEMPPSAAMAEEIETATWKGWALGSENFRKQLAKLTPRRLHPVKRGRPPKTGSAD